MTDANPVLTQREAIGWLFKTPMGRLAFGCLKVQRSLEWAHELKPGLLGQALECSVVPKLDNFTSTRFLEAKQ